MLDEREPAEAAIATLIADEFRQSGAPPFALPQPTSPPTLRAAALIAAGAPEAAAIAAGRQRTDQGGRRRIRLCHAERLHRRLPRRLRDHTRALLPTPLSLKDRCPCC